MKFEDVSLISGAGRQLRWPRLRRDGGQRRRPRRGRAARHRRRQLRGRAEQLLSQPWARRLRGRLRRERLRTAGVQLFGLRPEPPRRRQRGAARRLHRQRPRPRGPEDAGRDLRRAALPHVERRQGQVHRAWLRRARSGGALVGRGSAIADYDNDGDMDIAVSNSGGPLELLRNDGESRRLDRPRPARAQVEPPGRSARASRSRRTLGPQVREVKAGDSYLSSSDPRVHFGLGKAKEIRAPRDPVALGYVAGRDRREARPLPDRRRAGVSKGRTLGTALACAAVALSDAAFPAPPTAFTATTRVVVTWPASRIRQVFRDWRAPPLRGREGSARLREVPLSRSRLGS